MICVWNSEKRKKHIEHNRLWCKKIWKFNKWNNSFVPERKRDRNERAMTHSFIHSSFSNSLNAHSVPVNYTVGRKNKIGCSLFGCKKARRIKFENTSHKRWVPTFWYVHDGPRATYDFLNPNQSGRYIVCIKQKTVEMWGIRDGAYMCIYNTTIITKPSYLTPLKLTPLIRVGAKPKQEQSRK